ncbi:MAG: hypothetical protein Q8R33_21885 [Burkholderiales bacterium]|nr:hypothetical protein [Burkholderiales bacterium]
MIWTKTEAGRIEIQARTIVKERPQRNLLLVIDGVKTEEMLLANLAGISAKDFVDLHGLGLIVPLVASGRGAPQQGRQGGTGTAETPVAAPAPVAPFDYTEFTATLTQMISRELGLRGFVLTLAVEKAGTAQELQAVAQRTIEQIRERKGEAAAVTAQRTLFGA